MNLYAYQWNLSWENKEENYRKVLEMTESNTPQPGGVIVLPEMFATGFSMNTSVTAEPADGPTCQFMARLARQTQCYVIGGVAIEQVSGCPTNEALVISPEGKLAHRYAKLQPFSLGQEHEHYRAGEGITIIELPGGIRAGIFICYDLRFPEIFRLAMSQAEPPHLFVVIANWPNKRTQHWIRLLEARAIENLAYVVGVNRSGQDPTLDYDGASCVIDYQGQIMTTATCQETVLKAQLDLQAVMAWRSSFPALKDRRQDFSLGS